MKMKKLLLVVSLMCASAMVFAQSPMTTVLHKHRVEGAQVSPEAVTGMMRGFAACDPAAALPKEVLSPLGVKFLDAKQAAGVKFAFPSGKALKDRSVLVLVGNDPANMETAPDGRFLFYGGKYRLKKRIDLGSVVNLRGVAEMLAVGEPHSRVGVTYTFDRDSKVALLSLESFHGIDLRSRVDKMPQEALAKRGDVWVTLGEDGKSATCWRFID